MAWKCAKNAAHPVLAPASSRQGYATAAWQSVGRGRVRGGAPCTRCAPSAAICSVGAAPSTSSGSGTKMVPLADRISFRRGWLVCTVHVSSFFLLLKGLPPPGPLSSTHWLLVGPPLSTHQPAALFLAGQEQEGEHACSQLEDGGQQWHVFRR